MQGQGRRGRRGSGRAAGAAMVGLLVAVAISSASLAAAATTTATTAAAWKWTAVGQITGSFAPRSIACPSRQVCVVVGGTTASTSVKQPYILDEAVRTTNGGKSWKRLRVPSGGVPPQDAWGLAAVACPSINRCITVNNGPLESRHANLFVTSDGGQRWTSVRLPGKILNPNQIACPSSRNCYLTGEGPLGLLKTSDGGYHWRHVPLPARVDHANGHQYSLDALTCRSANACVIGYENTTYSGPDDPIPHGGTISTTDGGKHWRVTKFTSRWADVSAIACPTDRDCIATGEDGEIWTSHNSGGSWTQVASYPYSFASLSCKNSFCLTTTNGPQAYASNDLGRVWSPVVAAPGSARVRSLPLVQCWLGPSCLGLTDANKVVAGRPL